MVFGKYWMKNMKVSSKESEEISEKTKETQSLTEKKIRITHRAMRIYLSIPFDSYLYLFNLLIYYIMCIEP